MKRSDLQRYQNAAEKGWPVSPENKRRAIEVALEILENGKNRERMAACRFLLSCTQAGPPQIPVTSNMGGVTLDEVLRSLPADKRTLVLDAHRIVLSAIEEMNPSDQQEFLNDIGSRKGASNDQPT